MLFPLLALDGLIFLVCDLVAIAVHGEPDLTNQNRAILLAATIVLSFLADFFVIRAVWRAVNKPFDSSQPAAASTGAPDRQYPTALLVFGVILLVLGAVVSILVYSANKMPGPTPPAGFPDIGKTRRAQNTAFGPAIERDLTNSTMVDFDSADNSPVEMPDKFSDDLDENIAAGVAWMQQHGMDALWQNGRFLCFGMRISALQFTDWETLSPGELAQKIESADTNALSQATMTPRIVEDLGAGDLMVAIITGGHADGDENKPQPTRLPSDKDVLTWGFKTREGGLGILQVIGFDDHIQSVKIRYKLVRNAVAYATPNLNPLTTAAVFGLQAERSIAAQDADNQGMIFYKFKNNDVLKPPFPLKFRPGEALFVELTPELKQWIKTNQVDALFHFGANSWDMLTLEMQQDYINQSTQWATTTPDQVVEVFARKDADHLARSEVPACVFGNGYRDGWNTIEAFRTRDDTVGIYQIRGTDDLDGRGVEVRFKLVQAQQK